MNFSFYIAKRYFFSKKKRNFINVISLISMMAVAFGTAALIIVLSVFNGLEGLIRSLYNSFDSEISVTPTQGKTFVLADSTFQKLNAVDEVEMLTEYIEENVYIKYQNAQMVATIKGIGVNIEDYKHLNHTIEDFDSVMSYHRRHPLIPFAIVGKGVQLNMRINPNPVSSTSFLNFYYPKNLKPGLRMPSEMYNKKMIKPSGVFQIERQYDERYIFVPIDFTRELLGYEKKISGLEVMVRNNELIWQVEEEFETILGEGFDVKNSDEQHTELLKAIKIEKLFAFVALSFILAIASINIFFTLSMLAIEKKKDISILNALGITQSMIRHIFLIEGALIAFVGASIGLILGGSLCYLQQKFGFIGMGMETSIVEAYPVAMQVGDFIGVAISILLITFLSSFRPASIAASTAGHNLL